MAPYTRITADETYALGLLRTQGFSQAAMARALGRHPSTISRELRRNAWRCNGRGYVPSRAQIVHQRTAATLASEFAVQSRRVGAGRIGAPRGLQARAGRGLVRTVHYSHDQPRNDLPEYPARQAAGRHAACTPPPREHALSQALRTCDSRGRLAGKRHISTRPAGATNRSRIGHWEVDTVLGASRGGACIVTLLRRP